MFSSEVMVSCTPIIPRKVNCLLFSDLVCDTPESPPRLLTLARSDYAYINLEGPDPEPRRPKVLWVSGFEAGSLTGGSLARCGDWRLGFAGCGVPLCRWKSWVQWASGGHPEALMCGAAIARHR